MRSRFPLFGGGLLAIAASVAVAACGSSDKPVASGPTTTSEPIAIARVLDDFEYYGACGNETVAVGSTTFYPLLPRQRKGLDKSRYPLEDGGGRSGLMRVAPPGPGDDVGTMIVYTDGVARFESDSGNVIWLTAEQQTYNWVC